MMFYANVIVLYVFVVSSAGRVFYVDVSRHCEAGWSRAHGRCHIFDGPRNSYNEAKIACTNYTARLMVPRSRGHLVAVVDLSKNYYFSVDLVQIPGSTNKEGWILKDGTDLKDDPLWCGGEPNNYDSSQTLLSLDGKTHCLNDFSTQEQNHFVCEQGLRSTFIPDMATPVEYRALFDGNQETCADTERVISANERYVTITLNVTESREGDVFTVTYSRNVSCRMQKTLYIQDNNKCSDTVILKPCDWLDTGSGISTSCQYKCPCAGNGCEVVLVDHREEQSADICDISLIDSLDDN